MCISNQGVPDPDKKDPDTHETSHRRKDVCSGRFALVIPFRTALFSTFQEESIRNIRQEWEETNLTKKKLLELSQVSSRGQYTSDEPL